MKESKEEILEDFYLLSDYLKKERKIKDLNNYKRDFSAFLLHANHIKAYDFVAPFCKKKRVLDIGCFIGYGERRIFLQAKEVIAIDSNEKALEFARQNNRLIPNVNFKKVDARQLPFPSETFDIVIAFHLIEHIPPQEVNNFLREVKRVLKSGGLLFILTPNRKFRLLPFQKPFNPEHYQEFTAKTFLMTLKRGFGEVQIKGTRAKKWIEDIEKKRVHKSPYQVYIYAPLFKFLSIILPAKVKALLKKYKSKSKGIEPSNSRNGLVENSSEFDKLFQKFSMDDFFLESQRPDRSMDLFAICKK